MTQPNRLYAALASGELRQPSALKRDYELHAGNALVGTLHWPSALSYSCVAETADATWAFRQQGLFPSRMTARAAGSTQDVLRFKYNWLGMTGTIEHIDGRTFYLRGPSWWGNRYSLVMGPALGEDASGEDALGEEVELLAVKVNFTLLRGSADVTIQPQLEQTKDGALLAMFGCYVALLACEQMSGM